MIQQNTLNWLLTLIKYHELNQTQSHHLTDTVYQLSHFSCS